MSTRTRVRWCWCEDEQGEPHHHRPRLSHHPCPTPRAAWSVRWRDGDPLHPPAWVIRRPDGEPCCWWPPKSAVLARLVAHAHARAEHHPAQHRGDLTGRPGAPR